LPPNSFAFLNSSINLRRKTNETNLWQNRFYIFCSDGIPFLRRAGSMDARASQRTHQHGNNKAVVVLHPTQGNKAQGIVTFTQEEGGVRVVAKLTDVPKGVHGFHIHEFGDCSSTDGTSAGGHFNPTGMAHAGPSAEKRHVGDLGNITADDQGNAQLDYLDKQLAFSGANSIIGHAVILHANPDDFTTQPTGNAGGRIACGVIGVAK
jgi:Cu-Zn family superoxide dismutase